MRLESMHIDGFGIFNDEPIDGIAGGLTVIEGVNEAGKSTLVAFIRAVLFGFEDGRSRENSYEPLRGGRHGGRLSLSTADGRKFSVQRTPGSARGRVQLFDADGAAAGTEQDLAQLVGTANKHLFRNVFAFGLDELHDLQSLDDAGIRGRLYSAGTGAASLMDVDRRLETECQTLFTSGGHKAAINKLLRELEDVHTGVKALGEVSDQYRHLWGEIAELQSQVKEIEQQRGSVSTHIRHYDLLKRAMPVWISLCQSREQAKQLGEPIDFPADGLARLDSLRERLADAEERRHAIHEECEVARRRIADLTVDSKLLAVAADPEFQAEDLGRLDSVQEELSKVRQDLERSGLRLTGRLQQIGVDWDEQKLRSIDLSVPVGEQVREYRTRISAAEGSRREAQGDVERLEAERRRAVGAADEMAAELDANPLSATKDRRESKSADARRIRNNLVELAKQQDRLGHARQKLDDLRRESTSPSTSRANASVALPRWPAALLFLLLGIVAFSVRASGAGWGLGVLGLALSLGWLWLARHLASHGSVGVERHFDHATAREAEDTIKGSGSEIERLTAESRSLCSEHSWTVAEIDDLDAVERELREEELLECQRSDRWKEAATKAKRVEEELADAHARLASRHRDLDVVRADWSQWIGNQGLASELSPDGASETLNQLKQAKELLEALEAQRSRHEDLQHHETALTNRARAMLARCDRLIPDTSSLAGSLRSLQTEIGQTQQAAADVKQRQAALTERSQELARLERQIERLGEELAQLLTAGSAADDEAFRHNAERYRRQEELAAQLLQARSALEKMTGPGVACAELEAELSATTLERIEDAFAAQEEEQRQKLDTLNQANQRLGSLLHKRECLETSSECDELLQKQAFVEEQLGSAVEEWAIRKITRHALQRARQRYEVERQPRVLQDASAFFSRITDGAYRRVISPLGETHIELEKADGSRCKPEVLSRGTREQLYLCLRFGFVREYCQNTESLPIVMDDILVNFDPPRAVRTAEAIVELARSHQVLYLTCHPGIAELLQRTDHTARLLSLADGTIRHSISDSLGRALVGVR